MILPTPAVLRISGEDRIGFLQGLISQDVRRAAADCLLYGALLSPQGRFMHDMLIWHADDSLLLETRRAAGPELLAQLKKYRLRAKVSISDETGAWQSRAGFDGKAPDGALPDPRHSEMGWRQLAPQTPESPIVDNIPVAYDLQRLRCGIPLAPTDLAPGQALLIEANFDRLNGIDWKKGCYIGQEITARMHYRGLTKKRLMIVHGSPMPAPETPLFLAGEDIGAMRSHQGEIGLALLKLAAENQIIQTSDGANLQARAINGTNPA